MSAEEFLKIIKPPNRSFRFISNNQRTLYLGRGEPGIVFYEEGKLSSGWYQTSPPYYGLESIVNSFIRIECKIGSEYYPVWTIEDGEITVRENFIKLNGRYYTAKYLELLLKKIEELKEINL